MRKNKRVRFFRLLIYALIIILLFLPLILTSFLSMRLINRIEGVEQRLGEFELAAVAAIPATALLSDDQQGLPPNSREPAIDDGLPTDLTVPYLNSGNPLDDPVPEESDMAAEAPSRLQPVPAPLTGR